MQHVDGMFGLARLPFVRYRPTLVAMGVGTAYSSDRLEPLLDLHSGSDSSFPQPVHAPVSGNPFTSTGQESSLAQDEPAQGPGGPCRVPPL